MLVCCASLASSPSFPKLTGRVVDQAGMLPPSAESRLNKMLAMHENDTSNQLVVVTLNSLEGDSIESYGYQLGRHWGIGTAENNNGALLIIAKNERRIRIEVGYGLEEFLTDALASNIIHQIIRPAFKQGQYSKGITQGTQAMIEVLDGTYEPRQKSSGKDKNGLLHILLLIIFIVIAFIDFLTPGGRRGIFGRQGYYGNRYGSRYGGGFNGGSGGFGGGFGGGGGGFGGGGASGGW